jgi:hypothetical protein
MTRHHREQPGSPIHGVMFIIAAVIGCGGGGLPVGTAGSAGSHASCTGGGGAGGVLAGGMSNDGGACACPSVTPTSVPGSESVHMDLRCLCPPGSCSDTCPATLGAYNLDKVCTRISNLSSLSPNLALVRISGCGRVSYQTFLGFSGSTHTFDVQSGALVGVAYGNDYAAPPCGVSLHSYGTGPTDSCAETEIQRCTVCGLFMLYPPCSEHIDNPPPLESAGYL